jgi:hypothetical protein
METWRAVVGFEGFYEVSDHGNVRRIAPWCDGRKTKPGRISVRPKQSGYVRVILHREKVHKEFAVHRLVAAAFIGHLPSLRHQVNHKNGKRADNRVVNLEYLLPSENQLHACRVLHRPSRPGSKHHNAKLSENDVLEIRSRYTEGALQKKLAIEFGVSRATICQICSRQIWTHV